MTTGSGSRGYISSLLSEAKYEATRSLEQFIEFQFGKVFLFFLTILEVHCQPPRGGDPNPCYDWVRRTLKIILLVLVYY